MKKSAFSHYDLDQAKRKTLKVANFGGVDFSTQKFLVSNNHAIDIMNYIYKNGVVQKRNGYTKICQLEATRYWKIDYFTEDMSTVDKTTIENLNEDMNYYGIWNFKAEDGKNHVVAHIGKLLYEITNMTNEETIQLTPISSKNATLGSNLILPSDSKTTSYCYEMPQEKINSFVGGNKLWVLTGTKYMVLRYVKDSDNTTITKFYPVENSDQALIPTTTGGITYENSIATGRYNLDNVNLLTKYRKNLLLSGTTKNETTLNSTEYYDYTLDSPMVYENEKDLANVKITIKEKGVA